MSEIEKKWYVLRVITGKEKKVREYIESERTKHKLQDYITQVVIPTEKILQLRKGKKITKEKNYLPGYVVIEAALIGEVPFVLKSIPSVMGFLTERNSDEPTPLRMSEVNRILGKADELAETDIETNVPFATGETVKVKDGPFNGFNGIIEEVNSEKRKLKVMVKIFGRKTPLELSFLQVEKE
ncbi:MAG: transcription termination/antitermination protein NusG [Marinilabiliaceae bacterium]|nr:transcription termination/antitermination protein NusG [Marinilabiliaceae bacterium]